MDKKAVIKQWKILKMFDAYDSEYADSQESLLKKGTSAQGRPPKLT